MTRLTSVAATWLLLAIACMVLGCGGPQLKSVTLSPATADAKNFPNGQVQFVATGVYSGSSMPVQLSAANHILWCIGGSNGQCDGFVNQGASLSANGVAQCLPGLSSTMTVLAGTLLSSAANPDGGPSLKIYGSAQLTCP